jgi:hypothetical protein
VAVQGKKWDPSQLPSSLPEDLSTDVDRSTFTLADMVQWGISHPSEATDTLLDFKKELSAVTKWVPAVLLQWFLEVPECWWLGWG